MINAFGDHSEPWWPGVLAAGAAWTSAAGPQAFSATNDANANQGHITFRQEPNGTTNVGNDWGRTWNCKVGTSECSFSQTLMNVGYTKIYMNLKLDSNTALIGSTAAGAFFRTVAAHEMGHAIGLYHNTSANKAVMCSPSPKPQAVCQSETPTALDIGDGGCGVGSAGVRCVYGTMG